MAEGGLLVFEAMLVRKAVAGAFREAAALGHGWVGPEHVFLAILALADDSPSCVVLARLGIGHDEYARDLAAAISASDPPVSAPDEVDRDLKPNPAWYELVGRADGIALGLGAGEVSLEHLLLAFLWEAARTHVEQQFADVSMQSIVDALAESGVQVPPGALPAAPRASKRVFVPYEALSEIHGLLLQRLPPGSGLGLNWTDNSRAWVVANDDIDLEQHVQAIVAELGLNPVLQPDTD
jgi:hypothetical protein